MSERHVGGTHGSGSVSSVADVLWIRVVRRMRGVGGVCEMCMCLARDGVGGEGVSGERMGLVLYQSCWGCWTCVCVLVASSCCLPTPMALASGGSPMFPLVVHQPASPSIWPAVQSLRRGLSTNPGATMWCVCGCS